MNKQDILGELIYIGIVAEKGRCYGSKWKKGYKNTLRKHLTLLYKLSLLLDSKEDNIDNGFAECLELITSDSEINKFYNINRELKDKIILGKIHLGNNNDHRKIVNPIICKMLEMALETIKPIIVNKRRIYTILNSLHNLPRVYLGHEKCTLCGLHQKEITIEDALTYANDNADDKIKSIITNIVELQKQHSNLV